MKTFFTQTIFSSFQQGTNSTCFYVSWRDPPHWTPPLYSLNKLSHSSPYLSSHLQMIHPAVLPGVCTRCSQTSMKKITMKLGYTGWFFSCPEQLNRWPCDWLTHWLTQSLTDYLPLTYKERPLRPWPWPWHSRQVRHLRHPRHLRHLLKQSCRLATIETMITILTIENLKSWQSLLPDNQEWHLTAFAILATFYHSGDASGTMVHHPKQEPPQ